MKSATLLMLLFACIVPTAGRIAFKRKPISFCLYCCGPPPCCNYCGMNPVLEREVRRKQSSSQSLLVSKLLGPDGPCYNCYVCGPKPCCIQCPEAAARKVH